MTRIQFASGRRQLCALTLDTLSSGNIPEGTYYFWLQGRNDAGYCLPGPVANISVNGSQGIEIVIPTQAYIEKENWLEYAISVSTTNSPSTARVLLSIPRENLSLPATINLVDETHIETERQVTALPTTNLLNGQIVTLTSDGLSYRYNSFSNPSWERYFDPQNIASIEETTDAGWGCDTPIGLIDDSRYIINNDYALDGSAGPTRRYWVFNDTSFEFSEGAALGLTATIQELDVSSLFYNLFQVKFEGYFDQNEEESITLRDSVAEFSYLDVEIPYSANMENLILERPLLPNQAFQIEVFPEFDITQLGLGLNLIPLDASVNLIPFILPQTGRATDLGELLGDVIIGNDPNLRRVYPSTGLSAFVDTGISVIDGRISKVRVPSTAFGLQPNQAGQILAINSSGNVYPVSSLRGNERQRALVSTISGESRIGNFTSEIEGNSNPNITVEVNYPSTIRGNLADVIAGEGGNKATFNAQNIIFYVRKRNSSGGAIVETRRFSGFTPTNDISDEFSFLFENGTIFSSSLPSVDFGLYSPPNLTTGDVNIQNTTGTFFFDVAVSFGYNGGTITNIDHSVASGSVYELIQNLAELGQDLDLSSVKLLEENEVSGTSYTLALSDGFKAVTFTSTSNITVTIPNDSSTNFPVGTQILLGRKGSNSGELGINAASGVSLNGETEGSSEVANAWGVARLWKTASNSWWLFGELD